MKMTVILAFLLAAYIPVVQGTVYKVVDENGKVSFTQVPPLPKEDSTSKVEKVSLDHSSEARTRISTEFGQEYCGEISLPRQSNASSSSKRHVQSILKSKERWEESLTRISRDMEKSSQNQINSSGRYNSRPGYKTQQNQKYQKKFRETTQNMRDLRCAIHWASAKHEQIELHEDSDKSERLRLKGIIATLKNTLSKQCGKLPVLDPTNERNESMRKKWHSCSKHYVRDLNKVQNKLNRL